MSQILGHKTDKNVYLLEGCGVGAVLPGFAFVVVLLLLLVDLLQIGDFHNEALHCLSEVVSLAVDVKCLHEPVVTGGLVGVGVGV